jgi:hypothetical protein
MGEGVAQKVTEAFLTPMQIADAATRRRVYTANYYRVLDEATKKNKEALTETQREAVARIAWNYTNDLMGTGEALRNPAVYNDWYLKELMPFLSSMTAQGKSFMEDAGRALMSDPSITKKTIKTGQAILGLGIVSITELFLSGRSFKDMKIAVGMEDEEFKGQRKFLS